jgi:hypothetical protein
LASEAKSTSRARNGWFVVVGVDEHVEGEERVVPTGHHDWSRPTGTVDIEFMASPYFNFPGVSAEVVSGWVRGAYAPTSS